MPYKATCHSCYGGAGHAETYPTREQAKTYASAHSYVLDGRNVTIEFEPGPTTVAETRREKRLVDDVLAFIDGYHPAGEIGTALQPLRKIVTRIRCAQALELRELAYAAYRRADSVVLHVDDRAALDRMAALREEGDALTAAAAKLDPDHGGN